MPFGLCNASVTFERFVETGKISLVYMDDVMIFSETLEEHLQHLQIVLQKLREAGLKLPSEK